MLEFQEPEPMEFEYTSPNPSYCGSSYSRNEQKYTPRSLGSFPVPESFFENKYNRTTAIANKVADAFMSFTINDPSDNKSEVVEIDDASTVAASHISESKPDNDIMALKLYSPPLSPKQPNLESFARRTSSSSRSASSLDDNFSRFTSSNTSTLPPVEQNGNYNTQASSPQFTSKTIFNHTPNYNPSFIHSPHYTPSYTYIYERPAPTDPVAQSHGTIRFLEGLFKLILSAIVFGTAGYIIYQMGLSFKNDMVEKMNFYESDSINTQRECRTAYTNNRCFNDIRVPAIVDMCREWERCMYQPISIKRTRAFAETFADMANAFSEKLTIKTMCLSIILGIALIWAMTSIVMGHPNVPAQAPSSTTQSSESEADREAYRRARSKIETMKFEPGTALA